MFADPRFTDDELRDSFEVVSLSALPSIDDPEELPLEPDEWRFPRLNLDAYVHVADWRRIAEVAVEWLESGSDPLDVAAIAEHARKRELDSDDIDWLLSLFRPFDAIEWLRGGSKVTGGRKRLHALRAAGVKRCVVYTGRGERRRQETIDP